jgi:uncharacterized protein (TIGR03503 family)
MAKMRRLTAFCLVGFFTQLLSLSFSSQAQSPLSEYVFTGKDNTNQIPYFDNRFRIDAEADEIKLLFYRTHGSPPIILVRPDGSKLSVSKYPKETVEWFDDATFDMVKIIKPMPGPWQAVGDILPDSKIMVVSQVELEVEPLPEIMLAGETLKVSAKLFNGDEAIDDPAFRHVANLDVDFFSTNNSAYENFGAVSIKLTSFRDDGRILDEYAGDNIFTGEFALNFAPGEWIPVYLVKMPMVSRELRQKPVMLYAGPVSLSAETTTEDGEFHKIHFMIDDTHVNPESFIFQGKITYPDRQVESFSIGQGTGKERIKGFAFTEPGFHKISVSAFGETVNGREFRLIVPEFTFNVEDTELALPEEEALPVIKESYEEKAKRSAELVAQKLEQERLEREATQQEEQQQMMVYILIANLILIIIGLGCYFGWRWNKRRHQAKRKL